MRARTLRRRFIAAVAAALALGLLAAPAALADVDTFAVNSTGDANDANIGDDVCATAGAVCTLRAAIVEANDNDGVGETDVINFDPAMQDQTIQLTAQLDTLDEPLTVNGCSMDLNNEAPCVGLRGDDPDPALEGAIFMSGGATGVTIRGLAITNADRAIAALTDTDDLTVKNNWFGIKIDGTAEANTIGVELTADNAVIGGTGGATGTSPADRNVFANNGDAGLSVFVGDNTVVQGNYFGTNAAGTAAAANGTNIKLDGNGSNPPTDTIIGGTQPTPGTCSGPCNVISGATTNGINLKAASEAATGTSISGNFIGLNAAGTAELGNATGILVNGGSGTTIGGSAAGERNYITGGQAAINAFHGGPALEVTNNYIGTNIAGTAALGPPSSRAVDFNSDAAQPATITDNLIAIDAGLNNAIEARGAGASIAGNLIGVGPGGQDLGVGTFGVRVIETSGATTVSDNTIGNFSGAGLKLEGATGVTVTNNLIGTDADGGNQGGGTTGVLITSSASQSATQNTIGGDLAAEENRISNMAGDAIEVENADLALPNDQNAIKRNRGASNGSTADDLFIDLTDTDTPAGEGPGNPPTTGPNNGIQAPTVAIAGANDAGGTATPGSTVRVFSKATAGPGEIQGFLGSATTGVGGTWALAYGAPVANGTRVVATQTDTGDTSELSAIAVTDAVAPETQITSGPSGPTNDTTPSFGFSSEAGASFECRVDGAAFAPCASAFTSAALAPGAHTLQVRAVDTDLNRDATPASRSFEVDTTAPATTITKAPKKRIRSKKRRKRVTFMFASSEPGQGGFQCQIDSKPFVLCNGGSFTRKLKRGKHTFRVRAFDGAGNPDPTLAVKSFRILRPKRR